MSVSWKTLILTFLALRLFATPLASMSDGRGIAAGFATTLGVMIPSLLIASVVGRFMGRGGRLLVDWKAFGLTYLVGSFVLQAGMSINGTILGAAAAARPIG